MRTLITWAIIILIGLVAVNAFNKWRNSIDAFKQVTQGGFSVLMPGPAGEKEDILATTYGPARVRSYSWERGGHGFKVTVGNYPGKPGLSNENARFNQQIDSSLEDLDARTQDQKDIELGDVKGQELIMLSEKKHARYKLHVYVKGGRVYRLLAAVSDKLKFAEPETSKFFDSFKFSE